jgi:hypothetical protein
MTMNDEAPIPREPFVENPPENDPCNLGALGGVPIPMVFTAMLLLGGYRCTVVQDYDEDKVWSRFIYLVGPTEAKTLLKIEPVTSLTLASKPSLLVKS